MKIKEKERRNMSVPSDAKPLIPQPSPQIPSTLTPVEQEAQQPRGFLMVIFIFIASLLFSNTVLRGNFSGISMTVCLAIFYSVAIWYLHGRQNAFSRNSMLMLIPIALLSLSYLFDTGTLAWFVTTAFLAFLIPAQLTAISGACVRTLFSARILPETLTMLFPRLFSHLHTPFMALAAAKHKKRTPRNVSMALLGILLAIPFLLIFVVLFSSADTVFLQYLGRLDILLQWDFYACFFDLTAGFLLALFVTAFLLVLRGTSAPAKQAPAGRGKLHPLMTSSFLLLIILLQAFFIAVQCLYLFGNRALPEGTTYADYARTGFFQISAASLLTALLVFLISLFGQRGKNGTLMLQTKILLSVLTVFDFFLYFCACVRMHAYIQAYDLSVRRIGVCWLTAVMALILAGVAAHMWFPKINLAGWTLSCLCIMVIALNVGNPDKLAAKYNIDQYLASAPACAHLDTDYLSTLAPSVIPELDRLKGTPLEQEAAEAMAKAACKLEAHTWKGWCVTDSSAKKVLEKWGVSCPDQPN